MRTRGPHTLARAASYWSRGCVVGRESLATIKTKMDAEGWHELLLLSMGTRATPEEDDWPRCGTKRARPATPEPDAAHDEAI